SSGANPTPRTAVRPSPSSRNPASRRYAALNPFTTPSSGSVTSAVSRPASSNSSPHSSRKRNRASSQQQPGRPEPATQRPSTLSKRQQKWQYWARSSPRTGTLARSGTAPGPRAQLRPTAEHDRNPPNAWRLLIGRQTSAARSTCGPPNSPGQGGG